MPKDEAQSEPNSWVIEDSASEVTFDMPPVNERSQRIRRLFSILLIALVVVFAAAKFAPQWQPQAQHLWVRLFPPPPYRGDLVLAQYGTTLVALRASTGAVQWSLPDISTDSSPIIVGDTIIAVSPLGRIIGIRRTDGAMLWHDSNPDGYATPILIYQDGTHVITWFPSMNGDASLYESLDVQSGALQWRYATPGAFVWPGIGNSVFFCDPVSAQVIALDTHTGATRWRSAVIHVSSVQSANCFTAANDIIIQDQAQDTSTATVIALDSHTGAQLWRQTLPSNIFLSNDHMLFATNWFIDQPIVGPNVAGAYASTDGRQLWQTSGKFTYLAYDMANRAVIAVKTPTGIAGIASSTGQLRWHLDPPGDDLQDWQALYDDADTLYYTDHDTLYALTNTTGKLLWQQTLPQDATGQNFRGMFYQHQHLYVAGADTLTAYDAKQGHILWRIPKSYILIN